MLQGGLAVGVPGEIRGFHREWQKFGRVSWSQLFEPTILLCEEGYSVNSALSSAITRQEEFVRTTDLRSDI